MRFSCSPLAAPRGELLCLGQALEEVCPRNEIGTEPLQMRIGDLAVDQTKLPRPQFLGQRTEHNLGGV